MVDPVIHRRVGREEASGGFITIDDASQRHLPAGKVPLRFGEEVTEAQVVDVECLCKGEDKPHTHRRLMISGPGRARIRAGRTATLTAKGNAWLLAFR